MSLAIRDARMVVALDFGTAFSGFAYALNTSPEYVYKFYEWPDCTKVGGRPSCKTLTGLYYVRAEDGCSEIWKLKDWGWTALVSYTDALQRSARAGRNKNLLADVGFYVSKFKLHLAGKENLSRSVLGPLSADQLPSGLTPERCIADYLERISAFILDQLQNKFGDQFSKRDVQWCLTVPAIWDDSAKKKMQMCAEKAGMVSGYFTRKDVVSSPHPLLIILEPEAASFFCWTKPKHLDLQVKDQFLVADIGGGTTEIVVHARASGGAQPKFREVTASSGGLCGGSSVDKNFVNFLRREIGCFQEFIEENASEFLALQSRWQAIKSSFDGGKESGLVVDLPSTLARQWEKYDESEGLEPRSAGYDDIHLTTEGIKSIFDPVVDEIISLIGARMTEDVKVLLVAGGFSASPYLMKRIKQAFGHKVEEIINPPEPGCAICHGAVLKGVASTDCIVSRISRKTYGSRVIREFNHLVPTGSSFYTNVFQVFVPKGCVVEKDKCVTKFCGPYHRQQRHLNLSLYSCSTDAIPQYTTDEGVVCEGRFTMDISDGMALGIARSVQVSMSFGTSAVEMRAQRLNFGNTDIVETLPMLVEFDHSNAV